MTCGDVGEAFVNDNLLNYEEYVVNLLEAGSPLMVFAGEFDSQDGAKT